MLLGYTVLFCNSKILFRSFRNLLYLRCFTFFIFFFFIFIETLFIFFSLIIVYRGLLVLLGRHLRLLICVFDRVDVRIVIASITFLFLTLIVSGQVIFEVVHLLLLDFITGKG